MAKYYLLYRGFCYENTSEYRNRPKAAKKSGTRRKAPTKSASGLQMLLETC